MTDPVYWADAELVAVTVIRAAGATVGTRLQPGVTPTGGFVMVRRSGGTSANVVQDRARIDLLVWHDDDYSRMALAQSCRTWLKAAVGSNGIQRYQEFLGPTKMPDPVDVTREVVMVTVELTVRAT